MTLEVPTYLYSSPRKHTEASYSVSDHRLKGFFETVLGKVKDLPKHFSVDVILAFAT